MNGALTPSFGGFGAKRAHSLRLRSFCDRSMGAALASRVTGRDRTDFGGARIWVGCAACAPAGSLSRRRHRRSDRLPAARHRRQKRADPRAISRPLAHTWGPALAARDEGFGEPLRGDVGPSWGPGFSDAPAAYGGPGNVHIPAAVGPYGGGEAPAERNSSRSPLRPNARRRRVKGRPRTRLCRRPLHAKCPSRRRSMNPVRPRLATSRRLRPLRRRHARRA